MKLIFVSYIIKYLFYALLLVPFTLSLLTFWARNFSILKNIGILGSGFIFFLSIIFTFCYHRLKGNHLYSGIDFYLNLEFIHYPKYLNIEFKIDSISITFLLLTSFIFLICFISVYESYNYNIKNMHFFNFLLYLMYGFVILAFFTTNLFFFYVFFESVLIPMYLIIVIWGSRSRKIKAAYLFFMYTVVFSFFFFYALIVMSGWTPSYNYSFIQTLPLSFYQQNFIWICLFLTLAVKVPIFPFHLWLPEAHVEAPTVGSIILASILLKLGSYGLLRFLISLFPHSTLYFRPLVLILCFLGSIYGAVMALVQVDIKKIIAYSSISHMNFAILGLFSLNLEGILGSMLIFISHGLTSAGLFFLVGVLYKRFNTRLLRYYGGVFNFMPFFSFFFFFFTFSNIAFPGTLNYCSELLVFLGFLLSKFSFLFLLALILPFLISVVYSVLTYNKICFGVKSDYLSSVYDLTKLEFFILSILTFYTVFFGIFSYYLIDFIYLDISKISNVYKFI